MTDNQRASSLILASQSPIRAQLLRDAGLSFLTRPSRVDETALIADSANLEPEELALKLARAKAAAVADAGPCDLIIAADQVLGFKGAVLQKPADMAAARQRLSLLAGQTHELVTAVTLSRNGTEFFAHVETAHLTMHPLSPAQIDQMLALDGEAALQSVGAYRLEGPGIALFSALKGDYFAMLGLPLVPVLSAIRQFAPTLLPGAVLT